MEGYRSGQESQLDDRAPTVGPCNPGIVLGSFNQVEESESWL